MRFAFVTTDASATREQGGGSGAYVARMAKLLSDAGHEVEVFIPIDGVRAARHTPTVLHGCRVHPVVPRPRLSHRLVNRAQVLVGLRHKAKQRYWHERAKAIAAAVEIAHSEKPFDIVQCADSYGIGLEIRRIPGRLKIIRCTSPLDLYKACDGQDNALARAQIEIEERAIKDADMVFAPSQFTAQHYGRKLEMDISVLPTPIFLNAVKAASLPKGLPSRYLLHFADGLRRRKGTDLVAEALHIAWKEAPDLTMVWAGKVNPSFSSDILDRLESSSSGRLVRLPRQDRSALYALIRGAVCSVLPSRVDNLPNAALESLMLSVPVIAAENSSLEELIEPGVSGVLITNGSAKELANAMIAAWRDELPQPGSFCWGETRLGKKFQPQAALEIYLSTVKKVLSDLC